MLSVRRKTVRKTRVDASSDKRNKRPPRGQSPAVTSTPATPALNSFQKITLPARNSVGPGSNIPFSREPKARREALAAQLPLQEGRKVAFHPPSGSGTNGPTDESTWILAVVTRCINQDKNRSVPLSTLIRMVLDLGSNLVTWYRTRSHKKTANPERKCIKRPVAACQPDTPPLGTTTQPYDRLYHCPIQTRPPIPRHTKVHILFSPRARQSWRYIRTPVVSIERRC